MLESHYIHVDGVDICFQYDPETRETRAPGVAPWRAASLEDARDVVFSLFATEYMEMP